MISINRLTIGIDLDDVIWDLLSTWMNRYNELYDDNVKPEDIKDWNLQKYATKCSRESLFAIMQEPNFWENVNPKVGAKKCLEYLNKTHEIYIVTSTSYLVANDKFVRFFELFPFINFKQLITTYNKQLLNLDVLIDDYPENLCEGSYTKILYSRPHNENCKDKNLIRVCNWGEILETIELLGR